MLLSSSVSSVDNNGEGDSLLKDSNIKKVRFKESGVNFEGVMVVEDSITKEVHPKESDMIPEEVMVVESSPTPSLSWKDMLDVKKSVVDGVPSIDFSKRVYKLLEKEMSTAVVLKMFGRNLGITTLHNILYRIWKPSKPFQLIDVENGYFLAKFQSTVDYDKLLSQGPWVIFSHYLTVQPWTIDFNPKLPYPNMVLSWIQLPDLPNDLYQKQILLEIGGMVGKVTKLDFNTDSKARGRYVCIAVYVNLGGPLISNILINGSPQRIEYENLPMVCFKCGRYGRIKENCPVSTNSSELKEKGETMEQTSSPSVAAGDEEYSPWMLVERRSRRSTIDGIKKEIFLNERKSWDQDLIH
ncbi:hypothetical protein CXB51_036149 [Gossypium anomalum]|uniref:CCHC-type domain-containing protein n=1 Tax=Gossypium anomalum TaxID=47600 RepID=A0A8J6CJ89_9ROSI|nr:hypothetical protein CXB51_036149 [Gossypium anomalum]